MKRFALAVLAFPLAVASPALALDWVEVAHRGETAPGGGTYDVLNLARVTPDGRILYGGVLTTAEGRIYRYQPDTGSSLLLAPGPAPGGVTIGLIDLVSTNSQGDLALDADLDDGSQVPCRRAEFGPDASGALTLLVETGDPVPGLASGVFELEPFVTDPMVNDARQVAFFGFVASADPCSVPFTETQAIFGPAPGGGLALIARQGDAAPGIDGGTIAPPTSASPSVVLNDLDNAGRVVFEALVQVGAAKSVALYRAAPGATPEIVARTGLQAPGAPSGAILAQIVPPIRINAAGEVFFVGLLQVGTGGVTANDATALFGPDGAGGVTVLARQGSPPPGALAGETWGSFAQIDSTHLSFTPAGALAFDTILTVDGVPRSASAIYGPDASGQLELRVHSTVPSGGAEPTLRLLGIDARGDLLFSRIVYGDVEYSFQPRDGDAQLLFQRTDFGAIAPGGAKPVSADVIVQADPSLAQLAARVVFADAASTSAVYAAAPEPGAALAGACALGGVAALSLRRRPPRA